jgi:thiazole synthase ThiGH ThiG subunit
VPTSIQRERREISNDGRLLNNPGVGTLSSSAEVIAMGVGAVMALHSIQETQARVALARAATHHQVSVAAVAKAVLALVAGTDDPVGDRAGRAAGQLLERGFTG